MIGQLQNNFRILKNSTAIGSVFFAGLCLTPSMAQAAEISGDKITASTTMSVMSGFPIEQIADNITPDAGGINGFQTNAKSGTITLEFDQAYDIDGFKLWNDVVVRAEGIKTFRLDFKDANATTLSSQVFETIPREVDVQTFTFPKIIGITSVDLVVLSSLNEPANPALSLLPSYRERIEVREVAFTGQASRAESVIDEEPNTIAEMEEYIDGLQDTIKGHESDIRDLQADLAKETKRADSTFALLQERDTEIFQLKNRTDGQTSLSTILLWAIAGLGLGGLIGILLGRLSGRKPMLPKGQNLQLKQPSSEKQRQKPSFVVTTLKPEGDSFAPIRKQYPQGMRNYDPDKGKLIVEASMGVVVSGNSKLIAVQGPMPSVIPAVQKAYHAVGRVGEAQDGVAIGRDKSLGTAILIDENRVMTNRHVFDWNYENIDDPGYPIGVEFFGEKGSDATEFYELTTKDVVIIEEYDAVILTLAKPVPASKREPIKFAAHPPEHFDESDVFVIGYPSKPAPVTPEIEEAMDGDLIFGVKRYSQGKIYRHPQDTDIEYGIETHTSGNYSDQGWLLAICHQASTLPGNSGSAIISQKTGELVGIHFGSDPFNRTTPHHPANVAHSGMFLSKSVTFITSKAFKNYLSKDI